jgi:hypothetical protein
MKKEEFMNRQKRWERGENDMKHRKASVTWKLDTVELSKKQDRVYQGHPKTLNQKNQHTGLPILRCTLNNGSHYMAVQ